MKMQIVAIRDNAVEAYLQPNFVTHTGAAMRQFSDAVKDEKHEFAKHSEDFDLYLLGEFDDQTGLFSTPETPERLARGKDFKISL